MNDKKVAISGGLWTSISTAVTMLAIIARVMILTRFLEKSDFGIISITNMIIGLCTTFTDLGFASVIMYKQKLTDKEFSTLYWTQFFLFSFIYIVLSALSPLVASFYAEPALKLLLPIASLSIVFQAIGKLYDSVLQKQYRFKLLAFRNIISNLASLVLALWMAWMGYGVYSLVFSTLAQIVILNVWNLISGIKFQRVSLLFCFKEIIPLIKIGIYQTGTRILDFFSSKLDVMIIGKLLGTEVLGVYDLAKELVFKLVDFIRTVVSKVALPILSNNNNDDEVVKSRFLMITKIVAFLCIPICITASVFSKDIVTIMYGISYIDTAPLVSIFAILTMFTSITSFFDMLGISKGRTDLNFVNTIYRILISIPVIVLTSLISIEAVAWGQLAVTIVMVVIFWHVVVRRTYPISFKLYISQFGRLLVIICAIGIISAFIMYHVSLFDFIENWVLRLALYATLYCLAMVGATWLFLQKDIRFFIDLLKK